MNKDVIKGFTYIILLWTALYILYNILVGDGLA